MSSFSIILTSLHSLNLLLPLLFYAISVAISRFPPWFSHFLHFHSDSPHSDLIPHIPTLIFHIPLIPFPNSPFRLSQIAQFVIFNNFEKIVTLVQKRTLPYITTVKPLAPNYCLHHRWRHQRYHEKLLSL